MKKFFATVLLALALFTTAPARADSLASAENVLTAIQAADIISTQTMLHGPDWERNGLIYQPAEIDPLAKPFVRSWWTSIGSATAINLLVRYLDSHNNPDRNSGQLWTFDVVYSGIVAHNAYGIYIQRKFAVK